MNVRKLVQYLFMSVVGTYAAIWWFATIGPYSHTGPSSAWSMISAYPLHTLAFAVVGAVGIVSIQRTYFTFAGKSYSYRMSVDTVLFGVAALAAILAFVAANPSWMRSFGYTRDAAFLALLVPFAPIALVHSLYSYRMSIQMKDWGATFDAGNLGSVPASG